MKIAPNSRRRRIKRLYDILKGGTLNCVLPFIWKGKAVQQLPGTTAQPHYGGDGMRQFDPSRER